MAKSRKKGGAVTDRLPLDMYEAMVSASPLPDILSVLEVIEEFDVNAETTVIRAIEQLRLPARKMDALPGNKGGRWIMYREHVERLWPYRKPVNQGI